MFTPSCSFLINSTSVFLPVVFFFVCKSVKYGLHLSLKCKQNSIASFSFSFFYYSFKCSCNWKIFMFALDNIGRETPRMNSIHRDAALIIFTDWMEQNTWIRNNTELDIIWRSNLKGRSRNGAYLKVYMWKWKANIKIRLR